MVLADENSNIIARIAWLEGSAVNNKLHLHRVRNLITHATQIILPVYWEINRTHEAEMEDNACKIDS